MAKFQALGFDPAVILALLKTVGVTFLTELLKLLGGNQTKAKLTVGCDERCACARECLQHALCIAGHQLEILECCPDDGGDA